MGRCQTGHLSFPRRVVSDSLLFGFMSGISQQCYMCDSPATSREHVPPKCLFPERKDIPEENYRQGLITVPSCDAHNSQKCADDEFLMVSLGGIFSNNSIGYRHKMTKVNRAIAKSSDHLLNKAFLKRKHFIVKLGENKFIEVIRGTPDFARLKKCFEQIALGLFSHEFNNRFKGVITVLMTHLEQKNKDGETFIQFIKHRAELELKGKKYLGNNPAVFSYQFSDPDRFGLFILRMLFYGGCEIFVSFIPEGKIPPNNFGIQMLGWGIKTVIELEGKEYRFND